MILNWWVNLSGPLCIYIESKPFISYIYIYIYARWYIRRPKVVLRAPEGNNGNNLPSESGADGPQFRGTFFSTRSPQPLLSS